jgi:hypothetical protein
MLRTPWLPCRNGATTMPIDRFLLVVSLVCAASAALAAAAPAPPPELDAMRRALGAAVARHDVKATAALTSFPLAFSGYEHGEKVTAAQFAGEFNGLFFDGDAKLAACLATGKLEFQAKPDFAGSPWLIDCNGNEYYFGLRGGKWRFTAYENINE